MSKKAAKAFFEKMRTDEAFRTKVISVKDDEDRMTVINAEGFNCTLEEIHAIEHEMSEKDMDKICGGQTVFGEASFVFGAIKSLVINKLFK